MLREEIIKGSSVVVANGIRVEVKNGIITIDPRGCKGSDKPIKIDKDGTITGDVTGNIEITGSNITLVVEGDITGNITGPASIRVEGDIVGNISKEGRGI